MKTNKILSSLKKTQAVLDDLTKIGSQEIKHGFQAAKRQFSTMHLLKQRKELFAELGRILYESHEDGLPHEVAVFFKNTELQEIITEIKNVDNILLNMQSKNTKEHHD